MNTWKVELLQRAEAFIRRDTKGPSEPWVLSCFCQSKKTEGNKKKNLHPEHSASHLVRTSPVCSSNHSFLPFLPAFVENLMTSSNYSEWCDTGLVYMMLYFIMQVTPISFSALSPNEYSDIHVNFSILNSRQEKHDAPVVTKVDVEVAVDTVFATGLRAFTFCNQNSIRGCFF